MNICTSQEASVLRRKVEELEHERESFKTQIKDLTEKISSINDKTPISVTKKLTNNKGTGLSEEKIKVCFFFNQYLYFVSYL